VTRKRGCTGNLPEKYLFLQLRREFNKVKQLTQSLTGIVNIGLREEMPFRETSRIQLLNVFAVLAILGNLPFTAHYIQTGHILWPLNLFSLVVYSGTLWLNHREYYTVARWALFGGASLSLLLTAMANGRESGDYLLFIPVLFGAMLIFEFKTRFSLIAVILLTLCTLYFLEFTDFRWLAGELTQGELLFEFRANLALTVIFSGVIAGCYYTLYSGQLKQNQEMVEAAREMEQTITYFSTSLFGRNSEDEILWDVAKNCIGRLGFTDCVIYLLDEERQVLVQKAAFGPKNPEGFEITQPIEVPIREGIVGRAAAMARPIIVGDTSRDAGYISDDAVRLSEIAVPMVFNGRVLGVIDSEHPDRNFFTSRHLNIMKTIAALCTNKIIRARAEEEQRRARETRLEAEKIKALDEVKSRFFANISHEFRTPLTLIMGPLRDRLAGELPTADRRVYRLMYHNAERLLRLINQLMDLSRLEAGQMELLPTGLAVFDYLRLTSDTFAPLMDTKKITFQRIIPEEDLVLYCDRDVLEKAVGNLLSNAFKYTGAGGTIGLKAVYQEEALQVIVSDTGQGIPAPELSMIFDRFYRSSEASEYTPGSGIGLSLSRDLIQLHGGQLEVSSEAGKGSTFTIVLPLERCPAPSPEQARSNGTEGPVVPGPSPLVEWPEDADGEEAAEERLALVVDDHPHLRSYIAEHLRRDFRVLEAENAHRALEIAVKRLPDMIICDILMPGMSGLEFCRIIRGEEKTAHIPIILLTARADQESRLDGLESGADDYLTKPFDGRELIVRIRNILQRREQLTRKYAKMIVLQPQEMVIDSEDAVFIKRAVQIVEEHLDDADFTAETFSTVMNLSRMQLHRKLKALTKYSTKEFIRHIRLQRAAQLLASGRHNVSTIAYSVGFNNLSYFGKCFKDQYGISPSEYMQPKA